MTAVNNGGWAFPSPDTVYPSGQVQIGAPGMSLRQWYAGQAMAGVIANTGLADTKHIKFIVDYAIECADLMLAELEKDK